KENNVTKIIPANKELWCIADGKIVTFKNGQSIEVALPAHIRASALLVYKEGMIIAAENGKIYRFHSNGLDSTTIPSPERAYTFTILQDRKKRILLATGKGIYEVKDKTVQPFFIEQRAIDFP